MSALYAKLDEARKELLDLTGRNRMTNYLRPTQRRGGVAVTDEVSEYVFRLLVSDNKPMSFVPMNEELFGRRTLQIPDIWQGSNSDDAMLPTAEKNTDLKLQTLLSLQDLDRRLRRMHTNARTFVEEQGINALYVALGILQWYESDSSDVVREAPLILIPVELYRDNVRTLFKIRYTSDDIGFNISLQERLARDFSIHLPSVDDTDSFDVKKYMEAVQATVTSRPNWRVEKNAIFVDFFRFSKLHMYRDLESTGWEPVLDIAQHPVVPKLLGTHSFLTETMGRNTVNGSQESGLSTDANSNHQVIDADSSQMRAIQTAMSGRNLVIQGPPGTGKSQTITNIIAEAIGQGKTVLFVAEKMAALEVVKRRLDSLGLGDACLELHSDKSNKRVFLAELERTLSLGEPLVPEQAHNIRILQEEREELDRYCYAINTPVSRTEISPYQAYGYYLKADSRLQGTEPPELVVPGIASWSETEFKVRLEGVFRLQSLLSRMGRPTEHPFWGSDRTIFLPADQQMLIDRCVAAEAAVNQLQEHLDEICRRFGLQPIEAFGAAQRVLHFIDLASDAPRLRGINPSAQEWLNPENSLIDSLDLGMKIEYNRSKCEKYLLPEVFTEDLLSVRKAIASHAGRISRFFSGDYRRAQRLLKSLSKKPIPNDPAIQLQLVDSVMEVQRSLPVWESNLPLLQDAFGSRWRNDSQPWQEYQEIAQWIRRAVSSDLSRDWVSSLLTNLERVDEPDSIKKLAFDLRRSLTDCENLLQGVAAHLELNNERRFGAEREFLLEPFSAQIQQLHIWALYADRLQEMVNYNRAASELGESGLTVALEAAQQWPHASSRLADLVSKARYAQVIELAMHARPIVAGFDSATHAYRIQRFQELDRLLLKHNRAEVLHRHWMALPRVHAGGVALLREQFNRRRGHKSIRALMDEAGKTVQAIKPIFMMSPFTVAMFLPPGSVEFDMVVFDEASQVKPVDGIGAILRGRQSIVVGDDKQLPPTSFFDRILDEEEENADVVADTESILGLFKAKAASQQMLEWHYRSRHESLITVSNHEFYDNRLIVFPSPDKERRQFGLIYHHLPETRYKRGAGSGGHNEGEARAVAEAVMRHATRQPHQTLLVATFNQRQRDLIEDLIEQMRRHNPAGEAFFAAHADEPFAVKNLENVQGDERDVIFISIGYGRDEDNKLSMNFGPLNRDGGERRLNVLITRARERCEVFSNLTADDIDLSRTQAQGVRALKRFLKYARSGILDLPDSGTGESDSPFEQAVADALREQGYELDMQVGTGGYRIDLAIIDKDQPGRYLVGIECDGATYHSAQSARDRDRLRQEVLESMGWELHRIWSTDWFRNPKRQLQLIETRIAQIKARSAVLDQTDYSQDHTSSQPSSGAEVAYEETIFGDSEEFAVERGESLVATELVFSLYQVATPHFQISSDRLSTMNSGKLTKELARIVQIESPIHQEQLLLRISTRVTKSVREFVSIALTTAAQNRQLLRDGEFLLDPANPAVQPRNRSDLPNRERDIGLIHPAEIEAGLWLVVEQVPNLRTDDLVRTVLKLFGYQRVTENMNEQVTAIVEQSIKDGKLIVQGDFVQAGRRD